jgi:hypothetical protein
MHFIDLAPHREALFNKGQIYLDQNLRDDGPSIDAILANSSGSLEVGAIGACLRSGILTLDEVLATASRSIGVSDKRIARFLRKYEGRDPVQHLWYQAQPPVYALHSV